MMPSTPEQLREHVRGWPVADLRVAVPRGSARTVATMIGPRRRQHEPTMSHRHRKPLRDDLEFSGFPCG